MQGIRVSCNSVEEAVRGMRKQECLPRHCSIDVEIKSADPLSKNDTTPTKAAVRASLKMLLKTPLQNLSDVTGLPIVECNTGVLELEAGDEVQLFQLPRISNSALAPPVHARFLTNSDFETYILWEDESMTLLPTGDNIDLGVAKMVAVAAKHKDSGTSILFPLSDSVCDVAVSDLMHTGRNVGIRSDCHGDLSDSTGILSSSVNELMRCNFGAAWQAQKQRSPSTGTIMSCAAFEETLAAFQKSINELEMHRQGLFPAALHNDTLSLFDVEGTASRSMFRVNAIGANDGARCLSNVVALQRAAARVQQHWAALCSSTLPDRGTVLQFYEARSVDTPNASDFASQANAILVERSAQEALIKATRPAFRGNMSQTPYGEAEIWTGRAYQGMADVRAHYVGLGSIDHALQHVCFQADGAPRGSGFLLPYETYGRQLRQLLAKNESNDIKLGDEAYKHNTALVERMGLLTKMYGTESDPAFNPCLHLPARQIRGAAMLEALLASEALGRQGLLGTSASVIHSERTAHRLPSAPFLARLCPTDSAQHLALCQMHALVNTDHLHRITPPALYRRIVGCMESVASKLVTDPNAFRHLRKTEAWRNRVEGITQLFAEPMHPLVRTALGMAQAAPAGDLLQFMYQTNICTGYNQDKCLAELVDILMTHPSATKGFRA